MPSFRMLVEVSAPDRDFGWDDATPSFAKDQVEEALRNHGMDGDVSARVLTVEEAGSIRDDAASLLDDDSSSIKDYIRFVQKIAGRR